MCCKVAGSPQAKIIYVADKGNVMVLHVRTATSAKAVLQPGAIDPLVGYEECGKVATVRDMNTSRRNNVFSRHLFRSTAPLNQAPTFNERVQDGLRFRQVSMSRLHQRRLGIRARVDPSPQNEQSSFLFLTS